MDWAEGLNWLSRAAEQGSEVAQAKLSEILPGATPFEQVGAFWVFRSLERRRCFAFSPETKGLHSNLAVARDYQRALEYRIHYEALEAVGEGAIPFSVL
jgi:hypothetical protein